MLFYYYFRDTNIFTSRTVEPCFLCARNQDMVDDFSEVSSDLSSAQPASAGAVKAAAAAATARANRQSQAEVITYFFSSSDAVERLGRQW